MSRINIVKWTLGTLTAIAGAILLSINNELSKYGYIFFLISSITWSYIAYKSKDNPLLTMQILFTIINSIGIYNWII